MKRLAPLFLSLALLACLIPAAHADIIWEPDNSFYQTHRDDCVYVGRSYYANGPEGFVTLWDAPDGPTAAAQYENGFTLHVDWQYEDWGCATVWGDEETVEGWVPMSHLSLIYDHLSFEEEYGSQFRDYAGEFSGYTGEGPVTFWPYPGAAADSALGSFGPEFVEKLVGTESEPSYFSKVFTDENGLNWGYVTYLFGMRSFWVCLDDPGGTDLPVREVDQEPLIPAQPPQTPPASTLPYLLVAGVALVTALLLIWFYIRRRRTSDRSPEK